MALRITKKRREILRRSLCVDDLLYEKFRRLNLELTDRERRFNARRQISQVFRLSSNKEEPDILIACEIEQITEGPDGLIVIVR